MTGSRRALAGLFVAGLLYSFFGAILPSWGHHLTADYDVVGLHFLCGSVGILISLRAGAWLLPRKGTGAVLTLSCALAASSLLYLAAVTPPAPPWTRMIGVALLGVAAGLLQAAIFEAISPIYHHDPVATINIGGTLFGLGCLTIALLISGTFYVYTVPSVLILLAVVPGVFAGIYAKVRYRRPPPELHRPVREVIEDLRSPVALMFALLLFFQFGNEWAIAGWLPLFLVQRLGLSPAKSLLLLAVFWLAILVGRVVVQSILSSVRHSLLLALSTFAAMFGCMVLAFTDNRFGAMTGIILVGAGYASIYPLVLEKMGDRFPNYHPGFYNGVFAFALTGGFLAPCTLGYAANEWGIQVVMALPLIGAVMVLLLLGAIWVDSRLHRQGIRTEPAPSGPS